METVEETENEAAESNENGSAKGLGMESAMSRRGYWFTTHTVSVNMVMTKERLINKWLL